MSPSNKKLLKEAMRCTEDHFLPAWLRLSMTEEEAAKKKAEEEISRAKSLWELFRDLCDDDDTIIADAILGIIQEEGERKGQMVPLPFLMVIKEWCKKERPRWVEKRAEYLLKHGIPKRKEWSDG